VNQVRLSRLKTTLLGALAALLALAWLDAGRAHAEPPSFLAEVDRNVVSPGDVFVYEVTVNTSGERVDSYRPPDFKGLSVVNAPRAPNQSTQMSMGAGGTFIQTSYSWHYELAAAAGQKGVIAIGPARIHVDGREMRSNVVNIRVGAGAAPPAVAPGSAAPTTPAPAAEAPPPASAGDSNFIRAVPDKVKAYVGEQVTVNWSLYLLQRQDKYETITEPRTDGFWSEDVSPPQRNQLSLTQEMLGGRMYQVATLFKRALFPLQPGKLTISPMESEIAQVDFFGSKVRRQRLKTEPVEIEALPLPKAGQPDGFESSNVGKFTVQARADRGTIAVGEALTLTLEIRGQGNVRNVRAPALPRLDGWKSYEPKVTVNLDPGEIVAGTKTVEYLLLPERPGTTMIPSFELAYFDPAAKTYEATKSDPIRVEVTGTAASDKAVAAGGSGPHPASSATGIENVISTEIRPIRAHASLSRDLGATFYRSRPFLGLLLIPPLGLVLGRFVARVRERLAQDSQRNRRRRVRQMVRQRLGAAEDHRDAGRRSAFYIEIDRVVRDVLAARLRRPVTGLVMDELRDLLLARGMPADEAGRVIAELESCDLARFAPAETGATASREQMSAALERAGELIVAIDKAPLREEAGT
jgi:oxygen tolerance protein BatD